MKKSKRTLALILSIVLCVGLLAACGKTEKPEDSPSASGPTIPSETPSAAAPSNTPDLAKPSEAPEATKFAESINIILDNNQIGVLDPMSTAAATPGTNQTFTMVHDRLIYYSVDTGEYLPSLATEWKTDDYQTFTFKLRDDVTFHNGDKLTADDVVYTCNRGKEGVGSQAYAQWSVVDTVTAIDPYTVEFVTKNVNVDFYFNMSMPMAGILNERAITADPELGPAVGTGRFKLKEFVSNDYVTVERNDDYWGELALTKFVTLKYIPEVTTRTIMMQNGEAQVCLGIGTEDMPIFENDPDNYDITVQYVNNPQGISFNFADPITGDYNFRMAVLHGINKPDAVTVAAGDWALPNADEQGTFWGLFTEFRNEDIEGIPYDPELAKEYLAKSNYNGEPVEIAASVITNVKAAEVFQQNLAAIGIDIKITQLDAPSLYALYNGESNNSQIIFHGFNFTLNSASARHNFVPGGAQNRSSYDRPEVTALLDEAAGTLDKAKREELFMKVQELVAEDRPCQNIMWRIFGQVTVEGLGGIYFPPDTHWTDFRGIYLPIEG